MTDVSQMKERVEAAVKRVDPKLMTGTFYDDASDRLFVTIVNGSRKVSVTLKGRDFANGGAEKIDNAIEDGLRRLGTTPIG
jgi:hypothetical protein